MGVIIGISPKKYDVACNGVKLPKVKLRAFNIGLIFEIVVVTCPIVESLKLNAASIDPWFDLKYNFTTIRSVANIVVTKIGIENKY